MSDILKKIGASKREEIKIAKRATPYEEVARLAQNAPPVRGFLDTLMRASQKGVALICEIKRASPSKGMIREHLDAAQCALDFASAGAACLSVLTDKDFFKGSADDLISAREASALPVLRKDFIYDPYQVAEARAMGADAVLLIIAAVDDKAAQEIEEEAHRWSMDVLLEVHTEAELARALRLSSGLIGINNRDLNTFTCDLNTTKRLAAQVPETHFVISESGIATHDDIRTLTEAGARGFLIGESLMRQDDTGAAVQALLGGAA